MLRSTIVLAVVVLLTSGVSSIGPAFRARGPASADPWLWATGQLDNAVNAYDLAQPGYPQVATITQGISTPNQATVDAAGTLYVANGGNGTVTEYPAGQTAPSVTLTGLTDPIGVAVDVNGDVYVTNPGAPSSIVLYRSGQTRPSRYIIGDRIQVPCQIFFDAARTLYVIDSQTGVSTMKHGTFRLTSLHLKKLGGQPAGLAQDPSTGYLYEGDAGPGDGLEELLDQPLTGICEHMLV